MKSFLEFKPTKNNKIADVPVVKKEFIFSVEIKPVKKVRGWSSVTQITDGGNCCKPGNRIPMVKFRPNSYKLHISFAVNGNGNRYFDTDPLKEGEYSTIVIKQILKYGDEYRYSISINGEEVFTDNNKKAQDYPDVKMYAGDNFFEPSDCFVRNLRFKNLGMWLEIFFFSLLIKIASYSSCLTVNHLSLIHI